MILLVIVIVLANDIVGYCYWVERYSLITTATSGSVHQPNLMIFLVFPNRGSPSALIWKLSDIFPLKKTYKKHQKHSADNSLNKMTPHPPQKIHPIWWLEAFLHCSIIRKVALPKIVVPWRCWKIDGPKSYCKSYNRDTYIEGDANFSVTLTTKNRNCVISWYYGWNDSMHCRFQPTTMTLLSKGPNFLGGFPQKLVDFTIFKALGFYFLLYEPSLWFCCSFLVFLWPTTY